ncbi:heme ABC transporter permease [Kordiimonas sp. SCSIO 12610]|uniref:heme ABC transporter permease n=1 Tax=Kordiimonas sp. SCSIO 12610 TaxID=2829597 RepID=UPI00210EBC3B|nr:heme ABC transporter permease [Kordiimonas sp. SCSIO 12610]UTW55631.1 heme ABC transporter permease [Kordiimonas sp. SCSIO 12610]
MHIFANPARFVRLANQILPWAIAIMALTLPYGLYLALIASPPDYQQGDSVRIMYIHVPSAWMAMFTYMVMASASLAALVWRHPLALVAGKAAAPIGAVFTALALITGALWGKPMWGTYWVWDGRLTSVLILFFLYLGYMAIWQAMDDEETAGRAASILALVGVVNLPIIKFSVDWWNTLHQPASVIRLDGPTIHADLLGPLLWMAVAMKAYFIVTFLWRMKLEINKRKLAVIQMNMVNAHG